MVKKKKKPVKKKKLIKGTFKIGKLNIPINGRLNYNGKEWKTLQKYCMKRDGGKICIKKSKDCFGAMHLHHKKALKDGGNNRPKNLAWVCHFHHCLIHPFMIKQLIKKSYG